MLKCVLKHEYNVQVQLIEMVKVFYNVVKNVPIVSYDRNNKEICVI